MSRGDTTVMKNNLKRLKVKGLDIILHTATYMQGNPDQQRFTIRRDVLTGNDTRWRSASSGSPLPELNGLWTQQSAAITDPPMAALWPSPHNVLQQRLTIFSIASITRVTYKKYYEIHAINSDKL